MHPLFSKGSVLYPAFSDDGKQKFPQAIVEKTTNSSPENESGKPKPIWFKPPVLYFVYKAPS